MVKTPDKPVLTGTTRRLASFDLCRSRRPLRRHADRSGDRCRLGVAVRRLTRGSFLQATRVQERCSFVIAGHPGVMDGSPIRCPRKTMTTKMRFAEAKEDEWPVCPWCKKELRELKYKSRGWLATWTVFWCPHCRSLLSTSTTFNG